MFAVARWAGLALMTLGALTAALGLSGLLFGSDPAAPGRGVAIGAVGLVTFAGGYELLRVGSRRVSLRPGQWLRRELDRSIKWVLLEGFVGLFGLGCAISGIAILSTGADATSNGAILLAIAITFGAVVIVLELARREVPNAQAYQLQVFGVALGLSSVVLLVVGVTAEDAGRLVSFGIIGALGTLGAMVGSARRD